MKYHSSWRHCEISRKRIYESINNTSFSRKALFKEKYNQLKYKLGRIPSLYDFAINAEFNPELIVNHKDFPTYHSFLSQIDDDYTSHITDEELDSLKFISKKLIKGIRPHELVILECLKYNKYFTIRQVEECLQNTFALTNQSASIKSAVNFLSLNFYLKENGEGYQANTVTNIVDKPQNLFFIFNDEIYNDLENNKDYKFEISPHFKNCLSNPTYRSHLDDALKYAFFKYENVYRSDSQFRLYEKYSREDVLRLLNWDYFMNGQNIGGYKIKYNTCPIFVTYDKSEEISQTINYEDHFISKTVFSWMSRNNRKTSSKELEPLVNYSDLQVELFIQKSNDEGIEFYYIGKLTPMSYKQMYRNIDGKDNPIVNFKFRIHDEVKDEIYSYFVND